MARADNAGGLLLPEGSVPAEKILEQNMRNLRVQFAAQLMFQLAPHELIDGIGLRPVEESAASAAEQAVACADALMRRLSVGPFRLPIDWGPEGKG